MNHISNKIIGPAAALAWLWAAPVVTAGAADWKLAGDAAGCAVTGTEVTLALAGDGRARAEAAFPVKGGAPAAVQFNLSGEALTLTAPLTLTVRWLDARGKNIDDDRAPLGFPPLARTWTFTRATKTPAPVADTVTPPDQAVTAAVTLELARESAGKARGTLRATAGGFTLREGEVRAAGLEFDDSGPADAGPVSAAPADEQFGENLVPNGALEDGAEVPAGWKIEGDNSGGAAEWVTGGAFSGKRALKISDRGPFVKSFDRKPGDPFVYGGKPSQWINSREEVSARWVAAPAPARAGQWYQAAAYYWLANRLNYDRLLMNPVRIQFLDANGEVIGRYNTHNDTFYDLRLITRPGWVFIPSRPQVAPEGTVAVRAAVVLHHAGYGADATTGAVSTVADNRGFVLVDNLALYALPEPPALDGHGSAHADLAWAAATAARAVPFVPSSPAHRPHTFNATVSTAHPCGVMIVPRDARDAAPEVALTVTNLLGDRRTAAVEYTLVNVDNQKIGAGTVDIELPSFGAGSALLQLPPGLPYGPYELNYTMNFKGEGAGEAGVSRLGLLPPRTDSPAEHARLDYPFSLWVPVSEKFFGTPDEDKLGQMVRTAGMGKTWFGSTGIYISDILQRGKGGHAAVAERLENRIATGKVMAATWQKYGVQPLGRFEPSAYNLPPEEIPEQNYIVETFTRELGKAGVNFWRWGTEFTHGGAVELDRDRWPEGHLGAQGQQTYLNWGRLGTLRQYYNEYREAYAAAKRGNPDCKFGPQSASDVQGNVLKAFFQLCTNQQIDSFGMNTYISAFSIWPPNVYQLTKNGVPDLPIYISEFAAFGAPAVGDDHLEREKKGCASMVTYWTTMLRAFPTLCHAEMWGMIFGDDEGSLTYRGEARTAYYAYAVMTETLGAGTFTAAHQPPGVNIYVRDRSVRPGSVAVVWAKEPDTQVELNVGGDRAELCDMWGNRAPLPVSEQTVTITAGPAPVYVISPNGVKPGASVVLEVSHATKVRGQYRVSVSVTNRRAQAVSGELELIPDGPLTVSDRKRAVSDLAPGATIEQTFDVQPVGDQQRDRRVTVRVRFTGGEKTWQTTAALNFHDATRGAAPVSDSAAPPWSDGELTQIADRADQVALIDSAKPWGGPEDISARAGFRWDEQNLYAIFRVTDDIYCPPEPGLVWHRDVIELLIDVNRTLTPGPNYTLLLLAQFPDGARLERWDGPLPAGAVKDGKISITREGALTVYETAIPWKEINPAFTPAAGKAISLAWSADEHDGPETGRRALSWFSLAHAKNPEQFGDLILVNQPAGK